MNKYLVALKYDGTSFKGSQKQPDRRTVQGCFEEALQNIHKEFIQSEFASRTDSGVHATSQVASFFSNKNLTEEKWVSSLNYYLPDDAKISKCIRVDKDFDVRRDATEREYIYKIYHGQNFSPIDSRYFEYIDYDLETKSLSKAYKLFIGIHDFLSFSGRLVPNGVPTKREIKSISHVENKDSLEFKISGKSFLYQQVRRMVGVFLLLMKGKITIQQISDAIEFPKKGTVNFLPSSKGLFLSKIKYENLII